MSRILLDTSGYAAFMRGHAEVKLILQGAEEIHLTPVVLGELLAGFFKGKNRLKNERELQAVLESPRVNVTNVDGETARRYAVIVSALRTAGTQSQPTTSGSRQPPCSTGYASLRRTRLTRRSRRCS